MNRRHINLKQTQWGSRGSQSSHDSDITTQNVLEEPSGPVDYQIYGRHRDQRMRMEDQDFDPDRMGMLWERKEYDDFPGIVNYPREEFLGNKVV